nr:hypothetical protein Itr_chr11CG21400 [Ipomoea trifida]
MYSSEKRNPSGEKPRQLAAPAEYRAKRHNPVADDEATRRRLQTEGQPARRSGEYWTDLHDGVDLEPLLVPRLRSEDHTAAPIASVSFAVKEAHAME